MTDINENSSWLAYVVSWLIDHSEFESPVEVLILIFQSFDSVSDVLVLSRSCKSLHSIWLANEGRIVWMVYQRTIRAIDDALVAVSFSNTRENFENLTVRLHSITERDGASYRP